MITRMLWGFFAAGFIIVAGAAWFHSATMQPSDAAQGTALELSLSSSAFENKGKIPSKYTCDASQISPPLTISGVPVGTKSLAIVMEDPDVPKQLKADGTFLHWLLYNIPADTLEIAEGKPVGVIGNNGSGKAGYAGPCPPPQYEPSEHRYVFTLYALDAELALKPGATKDAMLKSMEGHVRATAQLIGTYKRK